MAIDEENLEQEDKESLSEHRTLLANERTFAAWIRTGMAVMITGLAFGRILVKQDQKTLDYLVGGSMVALAIGLFIVALVSYYRSYKAVKEDGELPGSFWPYIVLISGLIISGICAFVTLIL
jgi:putative membrane protein